MTALRTIPVTLLASGLGGFLGSLLTLLLSPFVQHRVWRHQRREQLCLAVITDLQRLVADLAVANSEGNLFDADHKRRLGTLRLKVQGIFSKGVYKKFLDLQRVLTVLAFEPPNTEKVKLAWKDLDRTELEAARAMYADIGVFAPDAPFWLRRRFLRFRWREFKTFVRKLVSQQGQKG